MNGLNNSIKWQGFSNWIKKTRSNYLLSTRDTFQIQRYKEAESKGTKETIPFKQLP